MKLVLIYGKRHIQDSTNTIHCNTTVVVKDYNTQNDHQ